MAWTEDRWYKTGTRDDATTQEPTSRHGTGKRWRVRYETPDGMERSRSFDKKVDADRFRTNVGADLLRGTYLDPDAGKITLRKFAEDWLKNQTADEVSMVNIRFRVRHITSGTLGDKRLDQLASSPSAVQAWISGVKLAPYSVRQCFSTLSSICGAAVEDGKMARNPCRSRSIKLPRMTERKVVPLEVPVVAALREAMPPRFRAMIDAGAYLGERQGEIFALSRDDIDFLRKTVSICRQVKIVSGQLCFALPKRGKTRSAPLSDQAAADFSGHIAEFGTEEVTLPWHEPGTRLHGKPVTVRLMFTSPRTGSAVFRQRFNAQVWKPALRKAKIPETQENGMHVLRHTYASVLLHNGADVKRVAEYLGHKDASLTLRVYGHLMEGGEDRVRKILDSAFTVPSPAQSKIV